jgi:CBS domain-containing protein
VTPQQTNEHCMILMTSNRLRHLPVIENEKLLGLISIGDLVKGVIEDQKNLIEQLQSYIRGE